MLKQATIAEQRLSASLTTIGGVLVLIVLLSRRVPGIALAGLATFLVRCAIFASLSTALVVWFFSSLHLGVETLTGRIAGIAMIGLGGLAYFLLAMLTRTHESEMLLQTARGFLVTNAHSRSLMQPVCTQALS